MTLVVVLVTLAALAGIRLWLRRPLTPADARLSAVDVSIDLRRQARRAATLLERTAS